MSEMNKNSTFLIFRTVKTLMQGTQIDALSIEMFFKTKQFLLPTLMEAKSPAFLVNLSLIVEKNIKLIDFHRNI